MQIARDQGFGKIMTKLRISARMKKASQNLCMKAQRTETSVSTN